MGQLYNLVEQLTNPTFIWIFAVIIHVFLSVYSLPKFLWETPEEYVDELVASRKKLQAMSVTDVRIGFSCKKYFPLLFVSIVILFDIQNIVVKVFSLLILVAYTLVIVYIAYNHEMECILFLSYSNSSTIVRRILIQIFVAAFISVQGNNIYKSSYLWPILCLLECLLGIFSLFQSHRKEQKSFISVPTATISCLMGIQTVLVLFYWIFGTLYFTNTQIHHLHKLSLRDWITVLLFIHDFPFPGFFSIGLLILLTFLVYLNGRYLYFYYKNGTASFVQCVQNAIPLSVIIFAIGTGILFLSNRSNYINSIMLPVDAVFLDDNSRWTIPMWSTSEKRIANILPDNNRGMDGYEIVFQEGIAMYFDSEWLLEPIAYNARLVILDDFSNRPYLRLYSEMEHDGIVSFYAENQGGVVAQNCSFTLCDDNKLLKEYFPHDSLHISVDKIEPGETICLVTLRNQDMTKPCYNEASIKITINARFRNGFNIWRTSRQIVGDTYLSLRGITKIVTDKEHFLDTNNTMVATDITTSWSGQLEPKTLGERTRYTFQVENTSLIEFTLSFKNYYGGYYKLPPLVFICEIGKRSR